MRAWYGKGRYWFVVAASERASTAWAWYGYRGRWDQLGREFTDWVETDFGQAIDLSEVPAELLSTLAETLDRMASARVAQGGDFPVPWPDLAPAIRRYH
jgi:hypothetical protein